MRKISLLILSIIAVAQLNLFAQEAPAKVEIREINGKSRFYVNNVEFYVRGAGCEFGNIELLGKSGANSFRTWRTNNGQSSGQQILDRAQKSGLKVLLGIWLIPGRNGLNYKDSVAVAKQFDELMVQVNQYKNHPALLAWTIGNELNHYNKDSAVFLAINNVAKAIHKLDPNHPVTTPLAGCNQKDINYIKTYCPDLDFLSFQVYGGILNLQKNIKEFNWTKPYMVTEWGATGHWEVPKTEWKAPIEQTSSEKAKAFTHRFEVGIKTDTLKCLGSYVFLWGQKQEKTPTWYGMFTADDDAMETVDAMYRVWTGNWPENRCPRIDSVFLNNKTAFQNVYLQPKAQITATVYTVDPDNDKLTYTYEIMPESKEQKTGGDFENTPEVVSKNVSDKNSIQFEAPTAEGAYRLFFYVRDGKKKCGTANIPFFVKK
jgi:hypothetical protein